MTATPWSTEHFIYSWNNDKQIKLERGFYPKTALEKDPDELDRRTARCAVRALSTLFEGLLRPRSFEITTCWGDDRYGFTTQSRPPRWAWFLRMPNSPSDVKSFWMNSQDMESAALDEQSMLGVVRRALDDPCTPPEGERLVWDEMRIERNWALLPEPERYVEDNELRLDDYHYGRPGRLVALESAHDQTWVTTHHSSVDPFDLSISKIGGMSFPLTPGEGMGIELCINVNWTFWWRPGQGRAMLDRAVDRLRQQGWEDPEDLRTEPFSR